MPTVTITFVQATFVLMAFVHIRNISAVTDTIVTKLLGPHLGALIFVDQQCLVAKKLYEPLISVCIYVILRPFSLTIFLDRYALFGPI